VKVTTRAGEFRSHVVADDVWFSGRFCQIDGRWLALVVV
jgi:hypothetical protein